MAARVVLFGATGYTGRLVAEAMVERGMKPVLAGRSKDKVQKLAAELGCESLIFALDDQTQRRAVHATGRQSSPNLLPQQRR